MNEPQREMTLDEWMERLPECHAARKEFNRLSKERDELERKGKELCHVYGNALIEIHDYRAALEDAKDYGHTELCRAMHPDYRERCQCHIVVLEEVLAKYPKASIDKALAIDPEKL